LHFYICFIILKHVITIQPVTSIDELKGIKELQQENLRSSIDAAEAEANGFLSAEYSLDFLKRMHEQAPSIVAKDGETVAGYALVTLRSIAEDHPLLHDLVNTIDRTTYNGRLLSNSSYVVVGQLCVAKKYRGLGLVSGMYNIFKEQMHDRFEYCITDVAEANSRSLKAHLNAGFVVIDKLSYGGIGWNIVLWDWNKDEHQDH
jgi:hypothetical protein